jgi:hypothetical protein
VEFQINETTDDYQGSAEIYRLNEDRFVATWGSNNQDGEKLGIYGRVLDALGYPVTGDFQVNTHTADDQYFAAVSGWSNGEFVVSWTSEYQDGDEEGVFARRFDVNGQPLGPEIPVNVYTLGRQDFSAVAAFSSGRFLVVWSSAEQDGDNTGVYGRIFEGQTPITDELPINTYTTGEQTGPEAAAGPDDLAVVIWHSSPQDGDSWGVYGRIVDADGNMLTDEIPINQNTISSQWHGNVGAFAGGFGVTWKTNDPGYPSPIESSIWVRVFDWNGNALSNEFRVDTDSYLPRRPAIGLAPDGSSFVAWHSYDQNYEQQDVFARRFDALYNPLGPVFPVNQYIFSAQGGASVVVDEDGNVTVVWTSDHQDGSDRGIFGQRYDADGNPLGHLP